MNAVTLSEHFQFEIPQEVCEQAHLEAGQKLQVIAYGDCIELIPLRTPGQMRGFLKGLDTDVPREIERL